MQRHDPIAPTCIVCGAYASRGFGFPGIRSALPKAKSGRLWTCFEHRDTGEARWAAAIAATGVGHGAASPIVDGAKGDHHGYAGKGETPAQGDRGL